jgi:hypothetical protein
MPTSFRPVIGAVLLTLMTGCQQKPAVAEKSVCEALQDEPEQAGKPVVISGWYGNAYHWAGMGSKNCDKLVEVRFLK